MPRRRKTACSAARKVVAFVGVQLLGSAVWPAPSGVLDRLDSIHQLLEYLRVMDVGGGEHYGERNAVTVGHEVMFGARLPSVGRVGPNRFAPLFAGTLVESKLALDQSIMPIFPSRSSSARCRRHQTPALCQSLSRRQHVTPLPKPNSWGSIRHGMPLLRTKTMPESAARSVIRGLPPLALDGSVGSRGSTIRHNSSVTSSLPMTSSLASQHSFETHS
jgi:hypothetical protein